MTKQKSIYTRCVHFDHQVALNQGVNTPIFTSSSYKYPAYGSTETTYPRYLNTPNHESLSKKIAELENAKYAYLTSSGMAAITCSCLAFLKAGDHAIFQRNIYGGSYSFVVNEISSYGIEYSFFEGDDLEQMESLIKPNTKLVYVETPSNPLLNIIDLERVSKFAKKYNLISVVDNTFATPINQNPLEKGFDIVVHSATKYLSGHSDLIAGAIVLNSKELDSKVQKYLIHHGPTLDAQSCYLLERSIKTLALRIEKQNSNAQKIAEFLEAHKKVTKVFYPGLESFAGHELAKKQMDGYGAMLSCELACDENGLTSFINSLEVFIHAVSLGGVESLISIPRFASHSKMTPEQRKAAGINDSLVRISVGIEDANDLIEDLQQALNKI